MEKLSLEKFKNNVISYPDELKTSMGGTIYPNMSNFRCSISVNGQVIGFTTSMQAASDWFDSQTQNGNDFSAHVEC